MIYIYIYIYIHTSELFLRLGLFPPEMQVFSLVATKFHFQKDQKLFQSVFLFLCLVLFFKLGNSFRVSSFQKKSFQNIRKFHYLKYKKKHF